MSIIQQKALLLLEKQGQFMVGESAIPKPGPGQLLIKTHAAALNPVDWQIRDHGFGIEKYPAVIGFDGAGDVVEVGDGPTTFEKGDRVAGIGNLVNDSGTYQESYVTPAPFAVKIPAAMEFEAAATLPIGISTAAMGLYHPIHGGGFQAPWEEGGRNKYCGKPIVFLGGSGSIGSYSIQLARLSGFSPIVVTASPQHTDYLLGLGATHVVDRNLDTPSLLDAIRHVLPDGSTHFLYDTVSSPDTQKMGFELLAAGGRMVFTIPGGVVQPKEGKEVVLVQGNPFLPANKELATALFNHLGQFLEDCSIKPNKIEVLPKGLSGVGDGVDRIKLGQVSGVKLVVRVGDTV